MRVGFGSGEFFDFAEGVHDQAMDGCACCSAGFRGVAVGCHGPEARTINIASPSDDAQYTQGQVVNASYSCTDTDGVATCAGPVANGAALDTTTLGPKHLHGSPRPTASGTRAQRVVNYNVVTSTGGPVGGDDAGDAAAHARRDADVLAVHPGHDAELHGDARPRRSSRRRPTRRCPWPTRARRHRPPRQRHLLPAGGARGRRGATPGRSRARRRSAAPPPRRRILTDDVGDRDDHAGVQADHRRDRRAAHRRLRQDADLHAVDDEPVAGSPDGARYEPSASLRKAS